ncbi:MAG: outer membrane beta-barrel protein [Candidatus Marinimicrobia bacterium]|nr:outer membrane beta-barrel protein [Candidatus Neomarinimicrobiota bacterium]
MKKLIVILLSLLLINFMLAGETGEEGTKSCWKSKVKIGLAGSGNLFIAPLADNHAGGNLGLGFCGFMDYNLTRSFALSLNLGYNQVNIDYTPELKNSILYATLRSKYFFVPEASFSPFISAGLGPFSFTQENGLPDRYFDGMFSVGIGTNIALSEKIDLVPAVNYNIPNSEDIDGSSGLDTYLNFEVGLSFALGAKKEKPTPPPSSKIEKEVEKEEKKTEEEMELEPDIEEEDTVGIGQEVEMVEEVKEAEDTVAVVEEKAEKARKTEKAVEKETEKKIVEKAKKEAKEEAVKIEEKEEQEIESNYYEMLQYMTKPNDYLVKIANQMYDNSSKWRDIWNWNREIIGDNPDVIYPFNELELKKVPAENANKLEYEFYNYEVGNGETLWSIAAQEYGNPYSWIVIYRDNKEILDKNQQKVRPGTVLKLRSKLFN